MRKQPLGIMPRNIWLGNFQLGTIIPQEEIKKRCFHLCDVITRYVEQKFSIPIEWIEEYNKLIKYLYEIEEATK